MNKCYNIFFYKIQTNSINMLTSSSVDPGFKPRSGQPKNYDIGVCCFSAKHATLRRKSKDWLARNENNVSEWSDMPTRGL